MKKILSVFAAVVALSFVFCSCVNEDKDYCWQVTYTYEGTDFVTYQWGKIAVIKNLEQRMIAEGAENIKYSRTSAYNTMQACIEVGNLNAGSDGTVPNNPSDPTDDPVVDDPTDDPTTPDNPDTPTDPQDPENPENPDDPTTPDNPDDPTEPQNPENPENE